MPNEQQPRNVSEPAGSRQGHTQAAGCRSPAPALLKLQQTAHAPTPRCRTCCSTPSRAASCFSSSRCSTFSAKRGSYPPATTRRQAAYWRPRERSSARASRARPMPCAGWLVGWEVGGGRCGCSWGQRLQAEEVMQHREWAVQLCQPNAASGIQPRSACSPPLTANPSLTFLRSKRLMDRKVGPPSMKAASSAGSPVRHPCSACFRSAAAGIATAG